MKPNSNEILKPKKYRIYLLLFAISFAILACRNFAPFSYPTMYAEDGVWSGLILTQGFWHTAFHARPDFPVLGLVSLLKLSLLITKIFCMGDLTLLPRVIFFVSTSFVAGISVCVVSLCSSYVSRLTKFALWISVLLIPVGTDGNEIYGRILNLNWLFPVLQLVLILHILENNFVSKKFIILSLIFCGIASLTFPICIAFNLIAAAFIFYKFYFSSLNDKKRGFIISGGFILVSLIGLVALGNTAFTSKGGADLPFSAKGLVEFSFARLMLFPYLFPVYSHLNNIIVLFLGIFAVALVVSASTYIVIRRPSARLTIGFVAIAFFTYFSAMIMLRSGFTSWYGDFATTFPDRYFYGLNIIFLIMLIYIFEQLRLVQHKYSTVAFRLAVYSVVVFLLWGNKEQFEFSQPKMNWGQLGTFEYSVCVHMSDLGPVRLNRTAANTSVPIYPVVENYAWRVNIPLNELKFLTEDRCKKVFNDPLKRPF